MRGPGPNRGRERERKERERERKEREGEKRKEGRKKEKKERKRKKEESLERILAVGDSTGMATLIGYFFSACLGTGLTVFAAGFQYHLLVPVRTLPSRLVVLCTHALRHVRVAC